MAQAWGSASKSNLKSLQILQNKAIRLLFYDEYMQPGVHTDDLYKNHRILPIAKLSLFAAISTIYKIKMWLSKSKIQLTTASEIHQHDTRYCMNLRPQKPNNNWGKDCIGYRGIVAFNSLPKEISEAPSLTVHKYKLKSYLLSEL